MSEQKRYSAQELRDAADTMDECLKEMKDGNSMYWRDDHITSEDWKVMLRQAADAEEELAKVKASKNRWMQYQETAAGERNACIDELRKKDAEIAKLKARLEAVVKIAENNKWANRGNVQADEDAISHNYCMDDILRSARGEGSANA